MKGSKGQTVNAEQLGFTPVSEGFSEYKLSDGNMMRIRIVLAEVYRMDEVDEATGKHNYYIKSQPVVSIEEPKKKLT